MHNGNWFAVSRTIFDHHVVGIRGRPYTELEAWLWMLAEAEFEAREVVNKGRTIVIDPGQLMMAHAFLSKAWDWSPDKVRWFLKRLQNEAMITRFCETAENRRTNQIQIITICNYTHYQFTDNPEHQASNTKQNTKPTPSQHQAPHQASDQDYQGLLSDQHQAKDVNNSRITPEEHHEPNTRTPNTEHEDTPLAGARPGALEALEAFNAYNDLALRVGLPVARSLDPSRKKKIIARMREHGGPEAWKLLLENIERSSFLQGNSKTGWRPPGLAWFLTPANFVKVIEGAYGNGAHGISEDAKKTAEERMREYVAKSEEEGKSKWTQ